MNTHPSHPYIKNVNEIYTQGVKYSSPIYSIIDDPSHLYVYESDVFVSDETRIFTIAMPDGYTVEDIDQIYEYDNLLLCLDDGSIFFRDDAEPDTEWEFLEEVSELNKDGHIVDFAISLIDIYVLCDDMYVYELDY